MRQRCGPVIFCRWPISSSDRFLLSSSSNCGLGRWSMWTWHDLRPIPGSRVPLREATPYGQTPRYLIRDNDRKFGQHFARVAATSGIKMLRIPYRTPRANAVCERFLGSVRRECLDHFLIFREKQLHRLLKSYVVYFNQARPHQGLGQQIPDPPLPFAPLPNGPSKVIAVPVLGGLHYDFRRAV